MPRNRRAQIERNVPEVEGLREVNGTFYKKSGPWWIETGPDTTVIDFIHNLQQARERMPKGFVNDKITKLNFEDFNTGRFHEFDISQCRVSWCVEHEREETAEERILREEQARMREEQQRLERRRQFDELRREFGDNPEPLPEPEVPVNPIDRILQQVQWEPRRFAVARAEPMVDPFPLPQAADARNEAVEREMAREWEEEEMRRMAEEELRDEI